MIKKFLFVIWLTCAAFVHSAMESDRVPRRGEHSPLLPHQRGQTSSQRDQSPPPSRQRNQWSRLIPRSSHRTAESGQTDDGGSPPSVNWQLPGRRSPQWQRDISRPESSASQRQRERSRSPVGPMHLEADTCEISNVMNGTYNIANEHYVNYYFTDCRNMVAKVDRCNVIRIVFKNCSGANVTIENTRNGRFEVGGIKAFVSVTNTDNVELFLSGKNSECVRENNSYFKLHHYGH